MHSRDLVQSTYSKIAQKYTDLYFDISFDQQYVDMFLSYLKPHAKILDIGSGPGNFTKYISEKGFTVEGVDISPEMLDIAHKKAPGIPFNIMDMRELEFPDNRFDGVISAYSLIHIESAEIAETLSEFCRVLKPGGIILLIVQEGAADQIVDEPLYPGEKVFMNFFQEEQLSQSIESAGFKILETDKQEVQDENVLSNQVIYVIGKKK